MSNFKVSSYLKEMWRNIATDLRRGWLKTSLIRTFGFKKYMIELERGNSLLRVLEAARIPRLIAHPKLAKPLQKNMGWIGRWLGYKVIAEPFMDEEHISAMDYAILDDWKNYKPMIVPPTIPSDKPMFSVTSHYRL